MRKASQCVNQNSEEELDNILQVSVSKSLTRSQRLSTLILRNDHYNDPNTVLFSPNIVTILLWL